jgi:hypothetical protein
VSRRLVRENAFLVAAVLLPVAVVVLFLLFTVIPRWTVPPPQYDVLVQTTDYDQSGRRMLVELFVRDERLHATIRGAGQNTYPPRVRLWRFDHNTLNLQEVPLDLPDAAPAGEASATILVDSFRNQRVVIDTKAPDGYEVRTRAHGGGPGLIGDIFGMRRYEQAVVLANRGRTIAIKPPTPNVYQTPMFLGWVIDAGH